ncbi:YceI family protein [Fodinibius halophilus]|uniref:YceI family protein n=1 Tax=Fodinibius halophilus TaxID=1736908 RepID=A0A6M1TGW7_9BACT|nr:YceI family protein [Fodinibius halophilus]NGP87890.1 YceI family protein [Fodinibius halophilus]
MNISDPPVKKLYYIFAGLFLLLLVPNEGISQSYLTKSGHVEFDSSVPLHSFTGVSDRLVGKIDLQNSTIDFYVDVHTIETGIGKRDRDMLETLDAENHPFAEFYGKLVSDFNPQNSQPQNVTVEGEFTVHGVSQPLTINGTLQKNSNGLHVEASWTLNMKDYNIKPPGILFYRVSEKIDVSISATLPPKTKTK